MNIQEFAALKEGDKVTNPMTNSTGEVVEATKSGVRVVWGERGPNEHKFFYSPLDRAWVHWNLVQAEPENA